MHNYSIVLNFTSISDLVNISSLGKSEIINICAADAPS